MAEEKPPALIYQARQRRAAREAAKRPRAISPEIELECSNINCPSGRGDGDPLPPGLTPGQPCPYCPGKIRKVKTK